MKTYKRTRIIASIAILGSLALTGISFAATDTQASSTSAVSRTISLRSLKARTATSTTTYKKRSSSRHSPTVHTSSVRGIVQTINGNSFTIVRPAIIPHSGTTTATTTFTVTTSSSTVYMKHGALDSLADVTVGAPLTVTGTLDATTNTIQALGVNILSAIPKDLKKATKK